MDSEHIMTAVFPSAISDEWKIIIENAADHWMKNGEDISYIYANMFAESHKHFMHQKHIRKNDKHPRIYENEYKYNKNIDIILAFSAIFLIVILLSPSSLYSCSSIHSSLIFFTTLLSLSPLNILLLLSLLLFLFYMLSF